MSLESPELDSVSRRDRLAVQGHASLVVWFTGISGAGKSTIASRLEWLLHRDGKATYLLDGDQFRSGLSRDLSFSPTDRAENIRRAAEVCKILLDAGVIVLATFISPMRADRALASMRIGPEHFMEVFVDTSVEVAERRDLKGLYRRARSGELKDFTAISAPYERPDVPDVLLDTALLEIEEAVSKVKAAVDERLQTENMSSRRAGGVW